MKNLVKMMVLATAFIGTSMDIVGMRGNNSRLLSDNSNADNSEAALNLNINVEGITTENNVVAPDSNRLLRDMLAIYEESSLNEGMNRRNVLSLRNDKNEVLLAGTAPLNINTTLKSNKGFMTREVVGVSEYKKIAGNFFNPINSDFYDVFLGQVTIERRSIIMKRVEENATYYHLYCTVNENPEINSHGCGCCTIF